MRYVVVGAGAIGGVVGGRLSAAGADVVLVARGAHLDAIRRDGLVLQSPEGSTTLHVPAVEHPSAIEWRTAGDVALLATKTQDAAPALDGLRAAAGASLPIVCLQNGLEGARIARRRFERVIGAMVMLPSAYLVPTPLNEGVRGLANEWARARRPPGSMTIDELRRRLAAPA